MNLGFEENHPKTWPPEIHVSRPTISGGRQWLASRAALALRTAQVFCRPSLPWRCWMGWIHPGRLTWFTSKVPNWKGRKIIFQTFIIVFHVNFQECIGSWVGWIRWTLFFIVKSVSLLAQDTWWNIGTCVNLNGFSWLPEKGWVRTIRPRQNGFCVCIKYIYICIYIYLRISVQRKNIILKSIEYPAFSMLRTHINFSFWGQPLLVILWTTIDIPLTWPILYPFWL